MKESELYALVLAALAAELDNAEKHGATEEGVARAEAYVRWLRSKQQ